jgi:hypothetical protein
MGAMPPEAPAGTESGTESAGPTGGASSLELEFWPYESSTGPWGSG